jgi:predicted DNA-binding protein (UPF0251 family)/NAD-dependent SIR2 family protein deacetylase
MRTARLNGWHSPSQLLNAIGANTRTPDIHALSLNMNQYLRVFQKLGIEFSADIVTPRREHIHHHYHIVFNNLHINQLYYRTKHAAICPLCMQESDFHHYAFDLKLVSVCHLHGISLIESCPHCGEPLTWKKDFHEGCARCGGELLQTLIDADPSSTLYLLSLIENRSQQTLDNLVELHAALETIRAQGWLSSDLDTSVLALLSHRKKEKFIELITSAMTQLMIHPRVYLFPLLSSKAEYVRAIASEIFKQYIAPRNYSSLATSHNLTLNEAAKTLGISENLLRDLIKAEVVLANKPRLKAGWQVSLSSIHQLLSKLEGRIIRQTESCKDLMKLLNHPQFNHTFVDVVLGLFSGEIVHGGYQLNEGISSIKIAHIPDDYFDGETEIDELITLRAAASLIGWTYHHIQQLTKVGAIKTYARQGNNNSRFVKISEIKAFSTNYVISSHLAKEMSTSPMTLPKLLAYNGVSPAYSPKSHGCTCHVFRRSDLNAVDLNTIAKSRLPDGMWGPQKGSRKRYYKGVKTGQAAMELGISTQTITALIRRGLLNKSSDRAFGNAVTRESLNKLLAYKDNGDYKEITAVIDALKLSENEFYKIFLQTHLVELIDLYFIKLIHDKDIAMIKQFMADYVTTSIAAKLLGEEPYQFRNRIKLGQIHPIKSIHGDQYNLDVFHRKEVLSLCSQEPN